MAKESNQNILEKLGLTLIVLYLIMSQVMAVVYFFEYVKTHSIANSIFFGSITAEVKGFLWIIFIWF